MLSCIRNCSLSNQLSECSLLKCNFVKESDKDTSFFLALMSHKHQKNFIPAIQLSNGKLSSSVDEVEDAFVNFFKELLGTSKDTLPLDVEVSRSGPCIDTGHSGW
jgi:hypothetical protein